MSLKLSKEELIALGFNIITDLDTDPLQQNFYKRNLYAIKRAGNGDGFFLYCETEELNGLPEDIKEGLSLEVSSGDDSPNFVIESDIETLERFYELDRCLNKNKDTYQCIEKVVTENATQIRRIVEACVELNRLNKIGQQRCMKRLRRDKSQLRGKIVSLAQQLTMNF